MRRILLLSFVAGLVNQCIDQSGNFAQCMQANFGNTIMNRYVEVVPPIIPVEKGNYNYSVNRNVSKEDCNEDKRCKKKKSNTKELLKFMKELLEKRNENNSKINKKECTRGECNNDLNVNPPVVIVKDNRPSSTMENVTKTVTVESIITIIPETLSERSAEIVTEIKSKPSKTITKTTSITTSVTTSVTTSITASVTTTISQSSYMPQQNSSMPQQTFPQEERKGKEPYIPQQISYVPTKVFPQEKMKGKEPQKAFHKDEIGSSETEKNQPIGMNWPIDEPCSDPMKNVFECFRMLRRLKEEINKLKSNDRPDVDLLNGKALKIKNESKCDCRKEIQKSCKEECKKKIKLMNLKNNSNESSPGEMENSYESSENTESIDSNKTEINNSDNNKIAKNKSQNMKEKNKNKVNQTKQKPTSKFITLTRYVEKKVVVTEPLTLYREFTTTITKEKPIINYKVITYTESVLKTVTSEIPAFFKSLNFMKTLKPESATKTEKTQGMNFLEELKRCELLKKGIQDNNLFEECRKNISLIESLKANISLVSTTKNSFINSSIPANTTAITSSNPPNVTPISIVTSTYTINTISSFNNIQTVSNTINNITPTSILSTPHTIIKTVTTMQTTTTTAVSTYVKSITTTNSADLNPLPSIKPIAKENTTNMIAKENTTNINQIPPMLINQCKHSNEAQGCISRNIPVSRFRNNGNLEKEVIFKTKTVTVREKPQIVTVHPSHGNNSLTSSDEFHKNSFHNGINKRKKTNIIYKTIMENLEPDDTIYKTITVVNKRSKPSKTKTVYKTVTANSKIDKVDNLKKKMFYINKSENKCEPEDICSDPQIKPFIEKFKTNKTLTNTIYSINSDTKASKAQIKYKTIFVE